MKIKNRRARVSQTRQWKAYLYMIGILILLIWMAYTIELSKNQGETLHVFETVDAQTEVIYEEKVVPYIITETLPEDYNHKKEMVQMYLRSKGETEQDISTWDRIIQQESKYDPNSEAPTYWSQCSNGKFIELRDHGNGIMWQDNCSNYGLEVIETGYSKGLLHIIEPTKRDMGCTINNWIQEVDCAVQLKNARGFSQWASY